MNSKPDAYSIRSFVQELRESHPEEVIEVDDEVNIDFEITAYYLKLRKNNPVLLFRFLKGFEDFTLVTNIFGSEERLARIAGLGSVKGVMEQWSSVAGSIPSESIKISKDIQSFHTKKTGEDLNLFDLPIPSHYEMDGSKRGFSRYVTSGLTTTIDPENESVVNLSFARIQPFEKNKFAFDAGSHGHLWRHLSVSRKRKERLKMTILIGPNPIFYLLAASFIDNEYGKASKFFDVSFLPGYLNEIPIPSDTEIAIEAEFLPEEDFDEGPFAEYVGYMGYDSTKFVAEAKSILMKRNPVYYDIQSSNSGEHVNLFSIPRSSLVMKSIRETLPRGPSYEVTWPHYGGRFISFGYVDDCKPGLGKQLGLSILGLDPLWNKIVFVNEGMTHLDLETALANLASAKEFSENNIVRASHISVISSDPTRNEDGTSGKIVFVTKREHSKIERKVKGDCMILQTKDGSASISHDFRDDQRVNVIVADDIEINEEDRVGWAIATRLNPDVDIKIERDSVTFFANRKVPSVARVPENVGKRIEKKVNSLSDRIRGQFD